MQRQVIRVTGLQRSGNHAVVNWIRANAPGRVEFLNSLFIGQDPREHAEATGEPWDVLVCSYEDALLNEVYGPEQEALFREALGDDIRFHDTLILRDPFNLFASRLKWARPMRRRSLVWGSRLMGRRLLPELWKQHAREAAGATGFLRNEKAVILFNAWHTEESAREDIAAQLGLASAHEGRDDVAKFGGGSTFDEYEFDGKATEMDVQGRWRHMASEPLFRKLLADGELLELSDRLFGPLPGIGEFVASLPIRRRPVFPASRLTALKKLCHAENRLKHRLTRPGRRRKNREPRATHHEKP